LRDQQGYLHNGQQKSYSEKDLKFIAMHAQDHLYNFYQSSRFNQVESLDYLFLLLSMLE